MKGLSIGHPATLLVRSMQLIETSPMCRVCIGWVDIVSAGEAKFLKAILAHVYVHCFVVITV